MKKLITLLSFIFIITTLVGCNIEHARTANPNCDVYPVDGSLSDYTYVMYDRTTEIIKFVRINDSGSINKIYGSITLDEWVNKELPLRSITVGGTRHMSPIDWVDNNFSSRHMYISDDRLIYSKSSKYKIEVLHLSTLLKKISKVATTKSVDTIRSVDNIEHPHGITYVTVTNYVDTTNEKYKNIDFNFHD